VIARRIDTDPTGAGDAFMAGYVVARSTGFAPVGAARRAAAVVAAVLTQP
jgi:sugar/nucleoside kinase (ribokinase family)